MISQIAAVVVNWNKKKDVLDLVHDLLNVSEPAFDIFVVDNASTDGSVIALKNRYPSINIIENKVNLGGTGGFNSGMDTICKLQKYDYVWLLDNDVKINNNTLYELVKVMESDKKIGLVGSRILDIDDKTVTVETGGNFRWDRIGIFPMHRNTKDNITQDTPVDYTAICSALVRVVALDNVGLMDDRLFLLWDDMDWGICFKKKGYKTVASSKSVVYHGSFTERNRGQEIYYYYNIRNPLLVYTKHTGLLKRTVIFYRSLRYYIRIYFFFKNNGNFYEARLIYKAILDYMNNRWGRLRLNDRDKKLRRSAYYPDISKLKSENSVFRNIMVSAIGTGLEDNKTVLNSINNYCPDAKITVLVTNDRIGYYDNYHTYILDRTKLNNAVYLLKEFFKIKRLKFDGIAYITPTPFNHAVKDNLIFDKNGNILSQNVSGFISLFLLLLAMLSAEAVAHALLPFILFKSFDYK